MSLFDFTTDLAAFETPAMRWLRNAAKVIEERREQWAAEEAAAEEQEQCK